MGMMRCVCHIETDIQTPLFSLWKTNTSKHAEATIRDGGLCQIKPAFGKGVCSQTWRVMDRLGNLEILGFVERNHFSKKHSPYDRPGNHRAPKDQSQPAACWSLATRRRIDGDHGGASSLTLADFVRAGDEKVRKICLPPRSPEYFGASRHFFEIFPETRKINLKSQHSTPNSTMGKGLDW
jgi:hypothetical protein